MLLCYLLLYTIFYENIIIRLNNGILYSLYYAICHGQKIHWQLYQLKKSSVTGKHKSIKEK